MTNVRPRIVFGALVAILGAAMFLVVSGFALDHVSSKIFAAIAGGVAFPLAPVVWHAIGERRRTRRRGAMKVAPKSSLTGADRFWMRFAAVALVVIGPMVAIARFDVVRAAWHHGLWFIPEGARAPRDMTTLLRRVPGDAEVVVVFHTDDHDDHGDGVIAWGDGEAMVTAVGKQVASEKLTSDKLDDLNRQLANQHWLQVKPIGVVSTSDDSIVMSSPGWRGKVMSVSGGPSDDLRRELARAPQGAPFVAAFVPKTTRDAESIRSGVVWATRVDDKLVLEARAEARGDAAATKLVTLAKAALHFETKDIPDSCRDAVSKIVDLVHFTQAGAIVTVRAELPGTALMGLMMCAMAK